MISLCGGNTPSRVPSSPRNTEEGQVGKKAQKPVTLEKQIHGNLQGNFLLQMQVGISTWDGEGIIFMISINVQYLPPNFFSISLASSAQLSILSFLFFIAQVLHISMHSW